MKKINLEIPKNEILCCNVWTKVNLGQNFGTISEYGKFKWNGVHRDHPPA